MVEAYWRGHDTGNERLKTDAVRWMRAEFTTKTDARKALGVRTIIDDDNVYDHLKLMARFVRQAGFAGLLVGYDELVNLHKLANVQARRSNYEQILRILNDCLQGQAEGLGILMGGTRNSSTTPAGASTPTRPWRRGSPRTASLARGCGTSAARSSNWKTSPPRTSTFC